MNAAKPPEGLSERAQAFWVEVVGSYVVDDAPGRELLLRACQAIDLADSARAVYLADGLTVTTRLGEVRAHPMVAVERDARLAIARLLRELRITEEPDDHRPPKLGGRR